MPLGMGSLNEEQVTGEPEIRRNDPPPLLQTVAALKRRKHLFYLAFHHVEITCENLDGGIDQAFALQAIQSKSPKAVQRLCHHCLPHLQLFVLLTRLLFVWRPHLGSYEVEQRTMIPATVDGRPGNLTIWNADMQIRLVGTPNLFEEPTVKFKVVNSGT